MQECIVLDPSEDAHGMVAAKTTRQYTTRDQFNWPVRHPKGERILFEWRDEWDEGRSLP